MADKVGWTVTSADIVSVDSEEEQHLREHISLLNPKWNRDLWPRMAT